MEITLKDLRLVKQYRNLVCRHCNTLPALAAGTKCLPGGSSAVAQTMAAWRFYNNERIAYSELIQPLRQAARDDLQRTRAPLVLLVHDWCKLSYPGHASKQDQAQLAQKNNRGYELTTTLAVNGLTGAPLAPVEVHFKMATGVLSTRDETVADQLHLEQVLPDMQAAESWNLGCPMLHVIDREADSVGHFRAWHAAGKQFLVRGLGQRVVLWRGQKISRRKIEEALQHEGAFKPGGIALYQGHKARLWVAEEEVVLDQPARTMVVVGQGRKARKTQHAIKGAPLTLRLVIVQVRAATGEVLASWYLLSNASAELADTLQLARFYYWRWRIESYFKLLKSHGQQLEHWQQGTGAAIFRRMLVASMACAGVWALQADDSEEATELKDLLICLSGCQTKKSAPHPAPALLTGLWALLKMLELLEQQSLDDLKAIVRKVAMPIPLLKSG
jgi:hypothetical protein